MILIICCKSLLADILPIQSYLMFDSSYFNETKTIDNQTSEIKK